MTNDSMITITPVDPIPVTCHEANVRQMVDAIVADPPSWHMWMWASMTKCGTTLCAAGTTVVQHGYELLWSIDTQIPNFSSAAECEAPSGEIGFIEDVAADLLGLTNQQRERIFLYTSTGDPGFHPTVRQFVQRVADVTGLEFKISSKAGSQLPKKRDIDD